MKQHIRSAVAAIAMTALAACGASSTPRVGAFAPAQTASIVFRVRIPATAPAPSARGPQYVSAATQSVAFSLINYDGNVESGQTTVVSLVPGTNCTGSGSSTVCTASATAPVGSDVYSIATYQAANGSGTPLSLNDSVPVTIVAGSNALSTTLDGVVSSLAFAPSNANAVNGTPSSGAVSIEAMDASGDIIIGPGSYVLPSGASDSISISCQTHLTPLNNLNAPATAITSPAQSAGFASVSYDGTDINGTTGGPLLCSATDSGTNTATFTLNLSATGSTTWTIS